MTKDTNITVQLPTEISYWGSDCREQDIDRILDNLEAMIEREFSETPYFILFDRTTTPIGSGIHGNSETAVLAVKVFIEENWTQAL